MVLPTHPRVHLVNARFARQHDPLLAEGLDLADEVLMKTEGHMRQVIFGRPELRRPNGSAFGLVESLHKRLFIEMALLQEVQLKFSHSALLKTFKNTHETLCFNKHSTDFNSVWYIQTW